jgi:hypothetical protein
MDGENRSVYKILIGNRAFKRINGVRMLLKWVVDWMQPTCNRVRRQCNVNLIIKKTLLCGM